MQPYLGAASMRSDGRGGQIMFAMSGWDVGAGTLVIQFREQCSRLTMSG